MEKLAVFFAFFTVLASSRTLPPNSDPNFLDVSAAISKTQGFFSRNSRSVLPSMHEVHHRRPRVSPHFPLSFDLHPRLSVRGTTEESYKALTVARLGRDSARVKAIQTRLDLASLGIVKADLTPLEAELETEKLEGPVISGTSQGSGEYFSRVGTEAYDAMRDAFKKGTGQLPAAEGVALFDTCYDLSSKKSVEVPTVSFHFSNGKELALPAKNYMIPVDSSGTFCFAFAPTSSALGIIGNVQQQGTRVSYDLANSLIGFSPNKC
ncbi:hypothetical protein SASPL_110354 [Salvia splendens]|uniref:Peptidase A1 domain-containing protein n=1 Tax=Salvia splendens TaxID=180675 RepID=A0A8X8YAD0_SALSN|nr:hypothetical protein SASPL_110354 [Salvia splendens]